MFFIVQILLDGLDECSLLNALSIMMDCANLHSLYIRNSQNIINWSSICKLIEGNRNFTDLLIDYCKPSDLSMHSIVGSLSKMKWLKRLSLGMQITTAANEMNIKHIQELSTYFQGDINLDYLNLRQNKIDEKCSEVLSKGLLKLDSITSLSERVI